ncbi:hypothetical protein DYB36_011424, partial [Aphanomyces astaci]
MEETEAAEQQVEIVDVTAESDDDDGVAPSEDAKAAKLLEQSKAKRTEEAKAMAAADNAAKEAAEAASVGGKQGKASGKGISVKTESNAKAEFGGPERTGLARDEAFERELGFHWDRSRIFTPAVWGGVDLGYVRDVTRCLTVVGEFDESRDDWRYQTAN